MTNRTTRAVAMAASSGVALLLLTACAAEPAPAVTITAPAPTVVVTVTPTPTPTPTPVVAPPAPAPTIDPVPNASAPEVVEGPAVDLGSAPASRGSTTADADGNLLTYTVVSGDAFFDIAQRFDVPQQQLLRMNPSIPDFGETLYIGQVINLDWTTTR
nr:LysM domain [uncultured organism]